MIKWLLVLTFFANFAAARIGAHMVKSGDKPLTPPYQSAIIAFVITAVVYLLSHLK